MGRIEINPTDPFYVRNGESLAAVLHVNATPESVEAAKGLVDVLRDAHGGDVLVIVDYSAAHVVVLALDRLKEELANERRENG